MRTILAAFMALATGNAAAFITLEQFVTLYGEASRNKDQATLNTLRAYSGGAFEGFQGANAADAKLFCAPGDFNLTSGAGADLIIQLASTISDAERKEAAATLALLRSLQAQYPCKE